MKLTLETTLKHHIFYTLCHQYGSQKALAEALGVSQSAIGRWLRLRRLPSFTRIQRTHPHMEHVLAKHGYLMDEVFPSATLALSGSMTRKTRTVQVTEQQLQALPVHERAVLPTQVDTVFESERAQIVRHMLETISPREEQVIKQFYLDGQSLPEIAAEMGLSKGRVHQIHQKALRKLRHTSRQRPLREVY